jgi:hypothetical protein
MGCSPCEACRVESEMRQLVGGSPPPLVRFLPPIKFGVLATSNGDHGQDLSG